MKKVVFIGYGAMAKTVSKLLPEGIALSAVIVPAHNVETVQQQVPQGAQVVSQVAELSLQPDLVVEMAGQAGLKEHALAVLERGWRLAIISVGALADEQLAQQLQQTALAHQTQIQLLAGAVAGMDGLSAAMTMGLDQVVYQGRKPPQGWKGSHAENLVNLDQLEQATVFFKGSARQAAQLFPANANVAATIGLAGLGMDHTTVELIADPEVQRNTHTIVAQGGFGQMRVEMQGVPLADNPKTSTLAALSIVRALQQLKQAWVI